MPKTVYLILSAVILLSGLISFGLSIATQSHLYAYYCCFSLILGTLLLVYWSSITYRWQCSKCECTKELSFMGNLLGINVGLNEKYLYCESCNKRTLYKGIKKDRLES